MTTFIGAQRAAFHAPPLRQDACTTDLTSTVISAAGETASEPWTNNPDPPVDCFYVYPTISRDPTPNSDMRAGPEECRAAELQLARFGSRCRLFAPMYRQVTLAGLLPLHRAAAARRSIRA